MTESDIDPVRHSFLFSFSAQIFGNARLGAERGKIGFI